MRVNITAIDPGPEQSAIVKAEFGFQWRIPSVRVSGWKLPNAEVADVVAHAPANVSLAIEKIVANGQRVNHEVFDTAMWAGFYGGVWAATHPGDPLFFIPRPKIRWHIGKIRKVTDSVIRKLLTDRFGKLDLVGDQMAAFAVAVTCFDLYDDLKFQEAYQHDL